MTMISIRAGQKLPPKNLYAVLHQRHEELRSAQKERMEKRAKRKTPVVTDDDPGDEDPPEEELVGEFTGLEFLKEVRVTFKTLSLRDTRETRLRWLEALQMSATEDPDKAIEAIHLSMDVKRDAFAKMVDRIDGVDDGYAAPFSDEELALFEDNKLIEPVFEAGMHLQDLDGDTAGKYGESQR